MRPLISIKFMVGAYEQLSLFHELSSTRSKIILCVMEVICAICIAVSVLQFRARNG